MVLQQRQLGLSGHRARPAARERRAVGDGGQARPHRAQRPMGPLPPRGLRFRHGCCRQLSLLVRAGGRRRATASTPDKLQVVADKQLYKRRRHRQDFDQAALRRTGPDRRRHRSHHRDAHGRRHAGRHHRRDSRERRLGRRRLCAGHRLSAFAGRGDAQSRPRHRRGLDGPRPGRPQPEGRDGRAVGNLAAPQRRDSRHGDGRDQRRRSLCHAGRRR